MFGCCLGFVWVLFGFCLGFVWVLFGFCLGFRFLGCFVTCLGCIWDGLHLQELSPDIPSCSRSEGPSNPASTTQPDLYRKTMRLSSEQLEALDLNPGANDAEFSVVSKLQGRSTVRLTRYL
jgi:hypothetical protein